MVNSTSAFDTVLEEKALLEMQAMLRLVDWQ
jgi:hypothetical protein